MVHTAAHEAAHVVQPRGTVQLQSGIGEAGDAYERHADAVADRIVRGAPAGDLLDQVASPRAGSSAGGVQRLQFALDGDLRTAVGAHPVDAAGVLGLPAAHPIMRNRANNVPAIVAAETCLSRGDGFYLAPEALYAAGGKVFSGSNWYKKFMYHDESIRAPRPSDYSLYAPAEFFAETYTVFYEEAGRPGVTEADYGRLISNTTQREWIRTIHNRHMAPAGAVAGAGGGGPGPEGAPGSGGGATGGVEPGGGGKGGKSHRSGP